MARRCFEISKLIFNFNFIPNNFGELKNVKEELSKYLEKYASNTEIKSFSNIIKDNGSNGVVIELSKTISLNTANNILSHMLVNMQGFQIVYDSKYCSVTVMILG